MPLQYANVSIDISKIVLGHVKGIAAYFAISLLRWVAYRHSVVLIHVPVP